MQRLVNICFAVLSTLLSIFLCFQVFQYSYESSLLLRVLAVAMLMMSIVYSAKIMIFKTVIISESSSLSDNAAQLFSSFVGALTIFLLIVLCALVLPVLGFLITFALFLYVTQVVVARKQRVMYIWVALGLSAFIYTVFFLFLGVSLPDSAIGIDRFFKVW